MSTRIGPIWLIALCAAVAVAAPAHAVEKIAVFYAFSASAKDVEKALRDDPSMKDLEPTVFSKFRDFSDAYKSESFKYAIVPASFPEFARECIPTLQFSEGGETDFEFALIRLSGRWQIGNTNQGIVGLFEELGRKDTKVFLKNVLPNIEFKGISLVSKSENLFSLLALGNADYVLFRPSQFKAAQKTFEVKPTVVVRSKKVGQPVVCVKDKAADLAPITKLRPETLAVLGFDGLKEFKEPKEPAP